MTSRQFFLALAGCVVSAVTILHGQDVDRIRTLYVAAAYEEALASMPAPGAASTEIEQFRALCLLALGREGDARTAIERLVKAQPTFMPSSDDVSPKMRALFSSIRAGLIPDIVREVYAAAKKEFEAKKDDEAQAGFRQALALIDSLPEESRGPLADLRVLASEFNDLSVARKPKPPPPAPVPALPPPSAPGGPYVAATAINEQLPPWNPPDTVTSRSEYTGLLRIEIGADGKVTSATVVQPTHPAYDVAVLQAVKRWAYKPATRAGQPVPSQKEIRLRLVPR
jgi:TonB family protein